MTHRMIAAAGLVALAVGGAAIAQDRSPEAARNTFQDSRVPLSAMNLNETAGAHNDMLVRDVIDGRCYVRYVDYNADTGMLLSGQLKEIPCHMSIKDAVIEEGEAGVTTIAELRASVPTRTYGYRPVSFEGDWTTWTEHQDACDGRYRTYDRDNDTFYAYPGVRHFCSIGLTDRTALASR